MITQNLWAYQVCHGRDLFWIEFENDREPTRQQILQQIRTRLGRKRLNHNQLSYMQVSE